MPGALVIANRRYGTPHAKTAHGLVRGTARYRILGIIDETKAGRDAGEILDGRPRGIPVFGSIEEATKSIGEKPEWCVVGVATPGGGLPDDLRGQLRQAISHGMGLVSGLHVFLGDDEDLASAARSKGVELVDIRRPKPRAELRFWSGRIHEVRAPRVAVLGTDCALGKRTTARFLLEACREAGLRAEMVHTGQTGWLQGYRHGIILDSLPNDFVSGELERSVVECWEQERPDLIFLEGQSALRNPSGPCGAEFLLSAGANTVVLQHAPGRKYFEGFEDQGLAIADVADEIDLIRRYGAETLAVTLNAEGLDAQQISQAKRDLDSRLDCPVICPVEEGVQGLVEPLKRLAKGSR